MRNQVGKIRDKSKKSENHILVSENESEIGDDRFFVGLKNIIRDFLQSSSLHGLKYISDDKITIFERSFYGLSFIFVVLCSSFFISNIFTKWRESPIIITTSPKPTFTTSIPFPAVTICSFNQALKSRVMEINRSSSNYTLLMSLCAKELDHNQLIGQLTWKKFKLLLTNVAQPCSSMLAYCRFGSKHESCSKIFHSVLTDDGLCCTFNAIDPMFLLRSFTEDESFSSSSEKEFIPIDWTPEKGFGKKLPPKFSPRISAGTGSQMGLTVVLNASNSEYYCSTSKSIGYKILAHNPAEQPKIKSFGFLVTTGQEVRVAIEPQYQTAVPAIRSVNTKIRQCLFSDEGDLSFYRTYSLKNCQLECEARIILEKCNCILYYLPRVDPEIKICGPKDNNCTKLIQIEIQSPEGNYSCDTCLPACFELSYNPTVTATKLVSGDFITNDNYPRNLLDDVEDMTIMHFFFMASMFRSTTKAEIYGLTDFLSSVGGLLGLFMGFSVFSVIEILYFIFLRPHCNKRMQKRAKRKAERSLDKNLRLATINPRKPIRQITDVAKCWSPDKKQAWNSWQVFVNTDKKIEERFPYLS